MTEEQDKQEVFNELVDFLGGTTKAKQFTRAVKNNDRELAKTLLNGSPVTGSAGGKVSNRDLDEIIEQYSLI